MTTLTRVHLVRHGQVHNPDHVLYGRLPGYGLSTLGTRMAEATAEHLRHAPIGHLRCSPLQRTQETMAPIAAAHPDLDIVLDERVIEQDNLFAGRRVDWRALAHPRALWWLRNPLRPSWCEPYEFIVARVREAVVDAAAAAEAAGEGREAVVVSHELAIWLARLDAEDRSLALNAARRRCSLASVTTLGVCDGEIRFVGYAEPARHLLAEAR